jgi:predicted ATPase
MISELKIRNFKSLESVDLKLGHFNLLVGANASGKSNFLDALRFLQGVGNGFNIDEALDGRLPSGTSLRWPGIRGGSKFAAFRNSDDAQAEKIEFRVTFDDEELCKIVGGETSVTSLNTLTYNLAFSVGNGDSSFDEESLSYGDTVVVPENYKHQVESFMQANTSKRREPSFYRKISIFAVVKAVSGVLTFDASPELITNSAQLVLFVSSGIADMQFLDLLPSVLRGYSYQVSRINENGEGFAAMIHEIESNGSKPALLEWLKELRPDEVDDIYALEGLNNDFMVAIKEGNHEFRAPALSEGTLRFIALAAAFFQPAMPKVLVIEEIEKGLHPSRLRLLLELMRSQSKRTGTQVFATTHSPTLLNWLTEEDRKTTFVCTRDAESGATKMRSLAKIPRFEELLEEGSHIDELFAEGWLESAPQ